jgi:deoxycytidylate deaminase
MIKYPYLPKGRQISYVKADNHYMVEAMKVAMERSTDDRQPSGAVLVKNGEIIAQGSLQSRIKNKTLQRLHDNGLCLRKLFRLKTGEKYWLRPCCAPPKNHSEAMAIRNAQKSNKDVRNADMYFWGHWWCCKDCWNKMIDTGIGSVYLLEGSEILFNRSHPDNKLGRKNFHFFLEN